MKHTLPLFTALALGCGQVSSHLHTWQTPGDSFSFCTDVTNWDSVRSEHLGRVSHQHMPEAVAKLKDQEFAETTWEDARRMCPAARFGNIDELRPFLVRGVSYSEPTFSIVKCDRKHGWVYVYQATYNGEMYVPGVRYRPEAAPIVVFLEDRPRRVIASANVGGDGIFRGVRPDDMWHEPDN